jgi:hypothetical protein
MKIKMIARVSVIYTKTTAKNHISGYKNRKVVLDSIEVSEGSFSRDHISVFPQEWISNSESDIFYDNAVKGDYFEFEAELASYNNKQSLTRVRIV